jgi:hypothetical protein
MTLQIGQRVTMQTEEHQECKTLFTLLRADVTAPVPQYVSVTDSLHITVCFNEAISSNLISTATNYSISNGIGNPITATVSSSSTKCIDLVLASPLQNPTNYVLTLN